METLQSLPVPVHILPLSKMAHKNRGDILWRTQEKRPKLKNIYFKEMTSTRRGWYCIPEKDKALPNSKCRRMKKTYKEGEKENKLPTVSSQQLELFISMYLVW